MLSVSPSVYITLTSHTQHFFTSTSKQAEYQTPESVLKHLLNQYLYTTLYIIIMCIIVNFAPIQLGV